MMSHDDSWSLHATIHHDGATNAHECSTIRYGASTIQASSATVASRPPTNVHDQVSFLVVLTPSLFNNSLNIAGSTLRKIRRQVCLHLEVQP